jgi:hypothetical protein
MLCSLNVSYYAGTIHFFAVAFVGLHYSAWQILAFVLCSASGRKRAARLCGDIQQHERIAQSEKACSFPATTPSFSLNSFLFRSLWASCNTAAHNSTTLSILAICTAKKLENKIKLIQLPHLSALPLFWALPSFQKQFPSSLARIALFLLHLCYPTIHSRCHMCALLKCKLKKTEVGLTKIIHFLSVFVVCNKFWNYIIFSNSNINSARIISLFTQQQHTSFV